MKMEPAMLKRLAVESLIGMGAHAKPDAAFEDLHWKLAGKKPEGSPYTIYQLLNHMIYWQDWIVRWLDGEKPRIPRHASGGWPGTQSPKNAAEWRQALRSFQKGLKGLKLRSRSLDLSMRQRKKSRLEMIQTGAFHNSYHLGEIILLRKILGAWPPPSGGLTW